MLSLQTLATIEALLLSKNDPRWGEFMVLAQTIGEVQQAKAALMQARAQPAQPATRFPDGTPAEEMDRAMAARKVPGPSEPATPTGYREVG